MSNYVKLREHPSSSEDMFFQGAADVSQICIHLELG